MNLTELKNLVAQNNELLDKGYTKTQIAATLGYKGEFGRSTLSKHLKKAEKEGLIVKYPKNTRKANMDRLEYSSMPSKELTVSELWRKRLDESKRISLYEEAKRNIVIKVNEHKPIGLLLFGDPHIDDPGCNIERLLSDVEICETYEGVYGINSGDGHNNWVGRLVSLYADQETTKKQAHLLLEDLIKRVPWLFMVNGNHDSWNENYTSVLADKYNILNFNDEVSVALQFSNNEVFKIHSRHNYTGSSQWSNTQGIVKWAMTRGNNYDILIGGHKHSCGYSQAVSKYDGKYHIFHCEQLGSYKQYDDYSVTGGWADTNVYPSVFYILNPNTKKPEDKIMRFTNINQGAEFLKMIRGD